MAKFNIGEKIGSGGFGCVYKCERDEDKWPCALKECIDENNTKRFIREVRMQAPLRQENIVPIIAQNLEDEPPWFVMPLATYNLREYLSISHGEEEVWIIREISNGIKHAHKNGIIHRDIKPENILFIKNEDGNLYPAVSDFGLGVFINRDSPSITGSERFLGTYEYVAPEQYRDAKNVDVRADIFSIGKIFYEILTGEIPYPDIEYNKIPSKYHYIIRKACQNNPKKRYNNIEEMINDLDIINEERSLKTPSELIKYEIKNILEEENFNNGRIERIAQLFVENLDDNSVLIDILPDLPKPILRILIQKQKSIMLPVIEAYDKAVSGDLPFSYCDIVAKFYESVFKYTNDYEIKSLIIHRLPKLAYHHNRWYVRTVFSNIICKIDNASLILDLKEVLTNNLRMTYWCSKSFDNSCLPLEIKRIVKESEEQRRNN